jgi:hypothetical protein
VCHKGIRDVNHIKQNLFLKNLKQKKKKHT